jgi:putative oxidoreductase
LDKQKDSLLLAARVLPTSLFLLSGWQKLTGFTATVAYMASTGAPLPTLSALVAVAMECVVGTLLVVGFYTRPLALLLALYTIGASFIGHRYWTMTGVEEHANMIHFYKNIGVVGGLLLLALTGPGKYSLDRT